MRDRIAAVKKMRWRWAGEEDQVLTPAALASKVRVLPEGRRLPDSFLRTDWTAASGDAYVPRCLVTVSATCTAYLLDVNGDGKDEVLVMDEQHPWSLVAQEDADGRWHALATMSAQQCGRTGTRNANALPRTVAPALPDIEFDSRRYQLNPVNSPGRDCPGP